MQHMNETGFAICPICTPEEALALPHVRARNLVGEIDHPLEGRIPYLVSPLARAGLAGEAPGPAPDLGEQSEAILRELGYSDDEVVRLVESEVVTTATAGAR